MQCGSNLLASRLPFDFDGGAACAPTSGLGASGGVGATSGRWRDEPSGGEPGVLVCPEADTRTTNSRNKIARTEYFTGFILMRCREALRSHRELTTATGDRQLIRKVLPNREFSLPKFAATKISDSPLISDAVWVNLADN